MSGSVPSKTNAGRYFDDFTLGETIPHATPRTITTGDVALYTGLTGSRFALQSSDEFARRLGYRQAPIDDWLVFHIVFGKSVPDVSINAVANLGYAQGVWIKPVYPGDMLCAVSDVIGLKENASGTTGIVTVRTTGFNQTGETVLSYIRWVMVNRRAGLSPTGVNIVPTFAERVDPSVFSASHPAIADGAWDFSLSGSPHRFGDYAVGERIDHVTGMTLEEAEHQIATRLYQNTARVHFDQRTQATTKAGRRLVYGGVVISLARALSFEGLGNACRIAALNGGRHVAPFFAGNTLYAWSEVLEAVALPGTGTGALRLRTIATKDEPCGGFPGKVEGGAYDPSVVLDLDYWVVLPA